MKLADEELRFVISARRTESDEILYQKASRAFEAGPGGDMLFSGDWSAVLKARVKSFYDFLSRSDEDGKLLLSELMKPDPVDDVKLIASILAILTGKYLLHSDFPAETLVSMALLILRRLPSVGTP